MNGYQQEAAGNLFTAKCNEPFKVQWFLYAPVGPVLKHVRAVNRVNLTVLYGSQNKQRLFPYTALTDWFV
jgi:hypothetical protein